MTTMTTRTASMWGWVGNYGSEGRSQGILSEHLAQANLPVRTLAGGKQVTVIEGQAVKVLCSELIPIVTEDGPATGRCGYWLDKDAFACPGHQAEIESYQALSEVERWAQEREEARYCGM